jgi:hypothetical protein
MASSYFREFFAIKKGNGHETLQDSGSKDLGVFQASYDPSLGYPAVMLGTTHIGYALRK